MHEAEGGGPGTRYYTYVVGGFVCVLLCANLLGTKVVQFGSVVLGAGTVFFPASFLFGDVTVEVYGVARARAMVWTGFVALFFATAMASLVVALPPAPQWHGQHAFEDVFANSPRVALASMCAFVAGEMSNVVLFARLRAHTDGRHLWLRMVGSTVVGAALDSVLFYPAAFYGVWPSSLVWRVMGTNYLAKCAFEVLALPASYAMVAWLKEREGHHDLAPTRHDEFIKPMFH